jgi:hypothetical protein
MLVLYISTRLLACRPEASPSWSRFDGYTETSYKVAAVGPVDEPVQVHFGICAVFHVWTRYLASAGLECTG